MLEVEVRFGIPAERTFQRLLKATALAIFGLEEPHIAELPERLSPRGWSRSTARDRALHSSSGESQVLMSEIHQTRHRCLQRDGHHSAAEPTLDRTRPDRDGTWLLSSWNNWEMRQ